MKRCFALTLLLSLALTGCAGAPQSREAGGTAVVSLLAAQPQGEAIRLYAAAEGRGQAGPLFFDSTGATPAAAVEGLINRGDQVVSCAHVEHLLLAEEGAHLLPGLLSYAFQEPQQSTESQLWVVRGESLDALFDGRADVAKRMSVVKSQGKNHQGFSALTLRQAAARLAQGQALLIPALRQGSRGLEYGGFALYEKGKIKTWLTGPAALGAALLMGQRVHWTGSAGEEAMILQSTGARVFPRLEGGRLTGLAVRCDLEGVLNGGWELTPDQRRALEMETARAMAQALTAMQAAGADGAGLLGRAGLGDPLSWTKVKGQWDRAFPTLPYEITVEITQAHRQ